MAGRYIEKGYQPRGGPASSSNPPQGGSVTSRPTKSWVGMNVPGAKYHFVPPDLADMVEADLRRRIQVKDEELEWYRPFRRTDRDEASTDLPGWVHMDRTWWSCLLPGALKISFPDSQTEFFAERVSDASLRFGPAGEEYYKIHGWLQCIILTPNQRDYLLQKMSIFDGSN